MFQIFGRIVGFANRLEVTLKEVLINILVDAKRMGLYSLLNNCNECNNYLRRILNCGFVVSMTVSAWMMMNLRRRI